MEELTYKELAELLVASGDLTIEEAEELLGGDIDDSNDQYASAEHQMRTGLNPYALRGQQELDTLGRLRAWSFKEITESLFSEMEKGVKGEEKPGHSYTSRHLSTGGNWVYSNNAAASTATGATQRGDNKGSSSTAPARDKSTQTDSHINYRAKVGNKDYTIKARNPKQKALLARAKQRLRGKASLSS